MSKFTGKTAVITGGNSGIGLATAKELAANGAKVIIAGRDHASVDSAVQSIGENAFGVNADVTKSSDLANLFEQTNAKFGKVDILFVNAGIAKFAPLELGEEALFDELVNINFKGAFFTVKQALPYLNDNAAVIFNTTFATKLGLPGTSIYAATKAALRSLTRIFAAELVGRNIRVNAVSPGPIDTPIYGKLGMQPEAVQELAGAVLTRVPMNRFGTAAEVAKTVAFLASDDASYITGVEIDVDGGMAQL